jgi:Cytochrome c7 and related cytochrome c/Class III cytochrome C family
VAQIFPRRANALARGSLLGSIGLITVLIAVYWVYLRSPAYTQVGQAKPQPVPFSHQLHAGDMGIDCRYCHTTVETSSFAGMPDTKTCMNCHSVIQTSNPDLAPVRNSFATGVPLQWSTVNNLPDYVYFDHSIHINKGVGCSSCHGQVDQSAQMTKAESLQMGFCVNCHTHPGNAIRPHSEVFNMSWQPPANQAQLATLLMQDENVQSKLSCSTCHR